jgi:putative iron-dependent peroxidase
MHFAQPGILAEETRLARYLSFSIDKHSEVLTALQKLVSQLNTDQTVLGIGQSLVTCLGKDIPGLHTMPAQTAPGIEIPSTPAALWLWLRGNDRGEIYHRSRMILDMLSPGFTLIDVIDSFQYDANRDLSGYEDGTENPHGQEAIDAAIVQGQGPGLDGSSFVAVQQWLHDFDQFESLTGEEQDNVYGRHISNNEEFDEAPESAHVKRAAQESFDPEAFILRRSMPWADGMEAGLVFVAFGRSYDAFEAILNRMLGKEDSITDNLFTFTRPITGAYFWCPPVINESPDLSLLGISF